MSTTRSSIRKGESQRSYKRHLASVLAMAALSLVSVQAKGQVVGCSAEIDANIWNLNSLRRSP